ncbi:phosphoadenylyl-sulfate reductase [Sporolactobacillus terrae]|uniref:Adenosine 5'-phosphosulfate reductase n=1 Tax=Sporolactobacillus terrae TaxID=269673 RepID=A0A5K7X1B2_9BACL|nr:phosphoadenylyl-sulfate reductase [Sporolactobacillus terrae]BBN99774.1 putative phosphoadenosine phosphosulfate reductase [Sporolactobacillus terrae]
MKEVSATSNTVTYSQWGNAKLPEFSDRTALLESRKVLGWAFQEYGDKVVYSCSFGVEGMVLIDLIYSMNKTASVIFLDTDFHFKETYELIDRVEKRYPQLKIIKEKPALTPEQQAEEYGAELWKRRPDLCCRIRKIDPLAGRLKHYNAWISGLRHEQSPLRRSVSFVNKDERFQSVKICPLIHWKWTEIWDYVRKHDLPYNPLHDQNYPSIGCAYCTRPVKAGEDQRAGRWSAFDKTECGLHLKD